MNRHRFAARADLGQPAARRIIGKGNPDIAAVLCLRQPRHAVHCRIRIFPGIARRIGFSIDIPGGVKIHFILFIVLHQIGIRRAAAQLCDTDIGVHLGNIARRIRGRLLKIVLAAVSVRIDQVICTGDRR